MAGAGVSSNDREGRLMKRITVIDRYPDFIALMEAVLSERAYVVTGLDVDDARADDVAATDPDLVMIGMGPLAGDPARVLFVDARCHPSLAGVPFVVAATAPFAATVATAPDAVLRVPFDLDDLLRTVEALLTPSAGHRWKDQKRTGGVK